MAQQSINYGTDNNDGTGDTLRAAMAKIEANFTELYGMTSGGSGTFVWETPSSMSVMRIDHNLNKYPSVTVVESTGYMRYGTVQYISLNTVEITFLDSFMAKVYLN